MKIKSLLAASAIALAAVAPAMANTVSSMDADCNIAEGVEHLFTVTATTVDKCLYAGAGNINGNPDDQGAAADAGMLADGWTFIGDATGADLGQASGTFTIAASLYESYDQIAIGFKSGVNSAIDFAIFSFLTGTLGGTFTIAPPQGGGLSHAIMWGIGDGTSSTSSTTVPEPGSSALALMGLGLLGVGFYARRRKAQ